MSELTQNGLFQYRRKGDLTGHKLAEYIPSMLLTNLSALLLTSVDGIVAGNLVGSDALSSINIFYPVTVVIGAISLLTASGISTSISTAMGKNDAVALDRAKGASVRIMLLMAAVVGIVQIPVVWIMIRSYGLSDEMYDMTMQYAIGIMICAPLGLISTVGTYQMQIAGKMKMLMILSVIEGLANLAFDVLYTGVFHMGVAGTGYGTATANLIRCSLTVIFLYRFTDMYRSDTKKIGLNDIKNILGVGVPDCSYSLIVALQSYLIMKVLLAAFGTDGGVIKGVCTLCFGITNVLISGITGSMRPLMGLYAGADDNAGLRILMRQGALLNLVSAGLATLVVELRPEWFFHINGVHEIPEGGVLAVRLYALYFILKGFDFLLRMYLSNRKDSKYATILTVVGNATLPLFAFLLWKAAPATFVFLSYLLTEILVFAMSYIRYRDWLIRDRKELEENGEDIVLYMAVKPEEAVEASRELRKFAKEHGIINRVAYRAALCMEEMVAYAESAKAFDLLKNIEGEGSAQRVDVEVMVRFKGKDEAIFVTLDDGRCISLDKNTETQKLVTDNYELLRKVAKSVEYQYILNMNYTRFTF